MGFGGTWDGLIPTKVNHAEEKIPIPVLPHQKAMEKVFVNLKNYNIPSNNENMQFIELLKTLSDEEQEELYNSLGGSFETINGSGVNMEQATVAIKKFKENMLTEDEKGNAYSPKNDLKLQAAQELVESVYEQ